MRRVCLFLALLAATPVYAERIASYVDETGVKVFTNLGTNRKPRSSQNSTETLFPAVAATSPASLPAALARGADYFPLIEELSQRHGVDDDLVKAIISVESNFDSVAVSRKNCKGLMQLHPDTARRFGVLDVFDPAQNIEGGVKYLQFLLSSFDRNIPLVLAAYNAGENAVTRHNGIPPYRETQDYVKKVQGLYDQALASAAPEAPPENRHQRRIRRFVTADGRVIFTNTPELLD